VNELSANILVTCLSKYKVAQENDLIEHLRAGKENTHMKYQEAVETFAKTLIEIISLHFVTFVTIAKLNSWLSES
jgi:hypothetical protein